MILIHKKHLSFVQKITLPYQQDNHILFLSPSTKTPLCEQDLY
jgi:hypothetical protein